MPLAPKPVLEAGLEVLYRVILAARLASYPKSGNSMKQIEELLDAVHNLPGILRMWDDNEQGNLALIRKELGFFKENSWPEGTALDLSKIFEEKLQEETENK